MPEHLLPVQTSSDDLFSATITVTLTLQLLAKLNLLVSLSNQPPIIATTTGGTCCQFNLHVSNQAPSVITTRSGSCCNSRDEGRNGKIGADNKRAQRVNYKPVYPGLRVLPSSQTGKKTRPASALPLLGLVGALWFLWVRRILTMIL